MKIFGKAALAAAATAGLILVPGAQAAADLTTSHKHCLYVKTVDEYVLIAKGVSEEAWDADTPALDMFHQYVHTGLPGDQLKIVRINVDAECEPSLTPTEIVALTE